MSADTDMYNDEARESLKSAAQARLHEAAAYLDTDTETAADECITQARTIIEVWREQA